MSKLLSGSIDLSKIGELMRQNHPAVVTGKNGKKYLNLSVWINDNEDTYGNIASISIYDKINKKSEYIGNLKDFSNSANNTERSEVSSDLPF